MPELRERIGNVYGEKSRERRSKREVKLSAKEIRRWLKGKLNKINFNKAKGILINIFASAIGIFPAMASAFSGFAPFGLSYLAVENHKSYRFYLTYITVCIGSIIANGAAGSIKYISAASIYGLSLIIVGSISPNTKKYSAFLTGGIMAVCLMLSGGVLMYFDSFDTGSFLLLVCECLAEVTVALMLESGRDIWASRSVFSGKINDEEKLSLIVFSAILLLSLKNFSIMNFSVSDYAAALTVLITAVSCGAGQATVIGVILGIICAIGTDDFLQLVGVFGFSGFMAGFMSRNKKVGAVVGIIIANTILTVYINGALENNLNISEIILASVSLFLIPSKVFMFFKAVFAVKSDSEVASRRMMEMIKIKLSRISESFSELSAVIKQASDKNMLSSNSDISEMFDRVADKVCKNCKNSALCWTSEFNATYQTMFKLLEIMERRGEIIDSDVSGFFKDRCIKLDEFLNALSNQFEVYKTTGIWKSRMKENRDIITVQLREVSSIIESVKDYMGSELRSNSFLTQQIEDGLSLRGIDYRNVSVIANSDGRFTACTEVKNSAVLDMGEEKLESIIGGMLGKPVCLTNSIGENSGVWVRTEFEEEPELKLETGIAESSANELSGDSVKITALSGGKAVIMLSDGMGTGKRAASESNMVIKLLSKLLSVGFEAINAVRLINSIMLMLNESSSFATVDVCIIDLHTGNAKLIKTGAEPSYIKRDNELEVIRASALPIGMIAEAEAEEFETRLKKGDMLIMITDGIESKQTGDMWLRSFIESERSDISAKDMANKLICRAYSELLSDADDDMTAVVVKIK